MTSWVVVVVMGALLAAWIWRLGRHDRCHAHVERAVAACFSGAAWRGRIGLSIRLRPVGTGAHVRLSVLASSHHEVMDALVTVMQCLPAGVRVTLDGTVGQRSPRYVQVMARGVAGKPGDDADGAGGGSAPGAA